MLLDCFGFNKTHLGLSCRDHNRLRIGGVVLLTLHERANILWRDQFHLMANYFHLVRPVMRAATSFKNDQTVLLLSHKHIKLCARQILAELNLPGSKGTMNLKNILCQIDPNHHILHPAVLLFAWR